MGCGLVSLVQQMFAYCDTAITVTPFISNLRRTSGDVTAESGAANLPFDKLSDRL